MVKQPRVDAELCIGCGICETKCPVKAPAAVRVTSVGETRNPENQILLSEVGNETLSPLGNSALSLGERVTRDRRFHQSARVG